VLVFTGLSHKTAPIDVRERIAIARDALPDALARLVRGPAIGEAVALSTCNRVEIYAAPKPGCDLESASREASAFLRDLGGSTVAPHLTSASGSNAILHLFRVAASLDSLVVGEPQILGQLKEAIEIARQAKTLGRTLDQAMHRAVRVGKRVRTDTAIGEGQVSVSSIAVDLAGQIFGNLADRVVLLIGAGEMAEAAARLLTASGARLLVVNRSAERGAELAAKIGGHSRSFAELEHALLEADIVISSTSSAGFIVPLDLAERVRRGRRGRSLFLIDIALPRDVDPRVNKLENVYLYDIDDLSRVVADSLEERNNEAKRAAAIVEAEAHGFEAWTLERSLTPTIVGLRARTRAVLASEVERSLAGRLKHLGPADRQALALMIDAATKKLLHHPLTRLKSLAGERRASEHVEILRDLFDLPDVATEGEAEAEIDEREDARADDVVRREDA